jgi:subtilisin family serine protease
MRISTRFISGLVGALLTVFVFGSAAFGQSLLPDYGKLSPGFRQLVVKQGLDPRAGKNEQDETPNYEYQQLLEREPYAVNGLPHYDAILHVQDLNALQGKGLRIMATLRNSVGYYVTAQLTAQQVALASTLAGVTRVEPGKVFYPTNDIALAEAGVPLLHEGMVNGTKYTGRNAVVMIYDSGIDWRHLDFRDPADTTKTRILFLWDQTISPTGAETSPTVAGIATPYGVEYSKAQIEAQLATANPPVPIRERDINGHGTHVAGTAAGNGAAFMGKYTGWPNALFGKYKGVAPEADIIVVKGGNSGFSSTNIVNAYFYAQAKAQQLGKPVVVNMSLGGHFGPHDGTEPEEIAADNFCNSGPGRSAIIAGGNEGSSALHVGGNITAGGSASFNFSLGPATLPARGGTTRAAYVIVYLSDSSTATASVTSPSGQTATLSTNGSVSNANNLRAYLERGVELTTRPGPKRYLIFGVVDDNDGSRPATGQWTFSIQNVANSVTWDGWLFLNQFTGSFFGSIPSADNLKTIGMPGTSLQAITVGAFASRVSWVVADGNTVGYSTPPLVGDIAGFSSIGPTGDGRVKPDITAAGQAIVSSLSTSSQSSVPATNIVQGSRHRINQGTSMATPFVAGVATLMYGINPGLTHANLRNLLSSTARADAFTGTIPAQGSNVWGRGKVNPVGAVARLLNASNNVTLSPINFTFQTGPNTPPNIAVVSLNTPVAQRFTVTTGGWASQAFIQTGNGSSSAPAVTGNGNVTVRVFSNGNGNLPGIQIGNTVSVPAQTLSGTAVNPISLVTMRANLTPGEYHLVVGTDDAATIVRVAYDNNTTSDRASVLAGGNWVRAGQPGSGLPNGINFALGLYLAAGTGTVITNVENAQTDPAGQDVVLDANYPNPFSTTTVIPFTLGKASTVKLEVFNFLGQPVATLFDGRLPAGRHQVQWDAAGVTSGFYYYRLQTDFGNHSRRMVIAK